MPNSLSAASPQTAETFRDRFSSEVTLRPDAVAAYARAAGDNNPVHFDSAFAANTRYRRLIASCGHIVDLRGRVRGQDGRTAIGAKGRVLVTDTL